MKFLTLINCTTYINFIRFHLVIRLLSCVKNTGMEPVGMISILTQVFSGWPTLFCHRLESDQEGNVINYHLRQKDPKRQSVKAFHSLQYRVIAAGDSYNDTTMLSEAEVGILFHAPQNVKDEFPQFTSVDTFADLKQAFLNASVRDLSL